MDTSYCKKRVLKKTWSLNDLEKLRNFYAQNMSLKHMSLKLGRSISSINKMLDRQGIRQKNQKYMLQNKSKRFTNSYQDKKTSIKICSSILNRYWEEKYQEHDCWVDLEEVISFLEMKGHDIHHAREGVYDDLLIMDGRCISKARLLMEANLHREKDPRGPFYVEGVTSI